MIAGASAAPTLPPASPPFDPSRRLGALGSLFRPGVHETAEQFNEIERATARRLVGLDGSSVHRRPEDHTTYRQKNPDAIVRRGPEDPGRFTEFKAPTEPTTKAVKDNIIKAGAQLAQHGGGDAIIDGRNVDLTEDIARRGHARAVGQARQHSQTLPQRVRVILGDGRTIDLGEGIT